MALLVLAAGIGVLQTDCRLWDRDECLCRRALGRTTAELDALLTDVDAIADPVLRGATLFAWVDQHRGQVDMNATRVVCDRLPAAEVAWCRRHLGSAHLMR